MRSLNLCYIIAQLCTSLVLFHTTSHAEQPSDSAEAVIVHTIYQVKTVLIRQLATDDIEEMINKTGDMGATGYKLKHYSGGKMGWSMEDSKGREVYSVIFLFLDVGQKREITLARSYRSQTQKQYTTGKLRLCQIILNR